MVRTRISTTPNGNMMKKTYLSSNRMSRAQRLRTSKTSRPEQKNIECLKINSYVKIVKDDGNKYIFNGNSTYDAKIKYGLYNGSYTLKDVPIDHPIAILNSNINLTYSGDDDKKKQKKVDNIMYDFYHGDVKIEVSGTFDKTSIYCYNHGYMGGENILVYSKKCEL